MDVMTFLAEMQENGVSFGNRFLVMLTLPPEVTRYAISRGLNSSALGTNLTRNLMLRCDAAELPGFSFASNDNKINGMIYKVPYQGLYGETTLSFILSEDMFEKQVFDSWMLYIRSYSDVFRYYGNYVVPKLTIVQYSYMPSGTGRGSFSDFETTEQASYRVHLIDAYPVAVAPVTLNWADQDIQRLSVTFVYERWVSEQRTIQDPSNTLNTPIADDWGGFKDSGPFDVPPPGQGGI